MRVAPVVTGASVADWCQGNGSRTRGFRCEAPVPDHPTASTAEPVAEAAWGHHTGFTQCNVSPMPQAAYLDRSAAVRLTMPHGTHR